MTDAAYHAALHAALVGFALVPDPTGAGLCRRMAEWSQRDGASADDRYVAARFLRDVYECDGSAWSLDEFLGWVEPDEGVPYSVARALGEIVDG